MKLSIEANSVSAENQLADTEKVRIYPAENAKRKIAIVGNSITLHMPKADIGWYGEWGMAASCEEKDYCHLIMHDFCEKHPDTSFIIIQAADWERNFWASPENYPEQLKTLEKYDPDIIVFRVAENSSEDLCKEHDFADGFMTLCEHFSDGGRRKILVTESFWYAPWTHPGLEKAGERFCGKAVRLSDLGDMDEMKAIGLFEHTGVAAHPGDLGMRAIADRILERLYQFA